LTVDALDGNAIAGDLFSAFGREMTAVTGTCGGCGATSAVAELRVYARAPGIVVRCPRCNAVVLVLVAAEDECRAHVAAFVLSRGGEA
jgi:hypothetical protein